MTIQGSKAKYSKYIVPILNQCIKDNKITTFLDVCCGGANIVKNIKCDTRIAIDKNPYLIALWKELQDPNFKFPSFPTRDDWDRCKDGFETRDWYIGLVQIFTSYLARGFGGGYNQQEKQYWGRVHTVQKDLPYIKDIDFRVDDFHKMLDFEGILIYVDPPYEGTKQYDISKNFPYIDFWDTIRQASEKNWVFVSEQNSPNDFIPVWTLETVRQLQGNITTCTENLFIYNKSLASDYYNGKCQK